MSAPCLRGSGLADFGNGSLMVRRNRNDLRREGPPVGLKLALSKKGEAAVHKSVVVVAISTRALVIVDSLFIQMEGAILDG